MSARVLNLILAFNVAWSCPALFAADALPVRAAALKTIAVYPEHRAPATVVSNGESLISAEVAARVMSFDPRVGDVVAKDALIASLDCRSYAIELDWERAALEVFQAQFVLAERRLGRARELRDSNSLAEEALDQRSAEQAVLAAEIAGAEARIARAQVAVGRCAIRSPFRALLRERLAPVGQFLAVGDPIARLIDVDDLELSAQVSPSDIEAIESNAELEYISGESRYAVTVRAVVAAIDPQTRDREVRLIFPNDRPLSGSAGQLAWRDPRPHVPGKYLVRRADSFGLFTVANGQAKFVPLADAQAGRASAVGLSLEELIVTDGHYAVGDGQEVDILAPQ